MWDIVIAKNITRRKTLVLDSLVSSAAVFWDVSRRKNGCGGDFRFACIAKTNKIRVRDKLALKAMLLHEPIFTSKRLCIETTVNL